MITVDFFHGQENVLQILYFFIPGILSIKFYDLLIPTDKRNLNNFCLDIGLISIIFVGFTDMLFSFFPYQWIKFVGIFILPVISTFLFVKLITSECLASVIANPIPGPWDFVFKKRKAYWMKIYLKNGDVIGGYYGENSFVSSYPHCKEIYI